MRAPHFLTHNKGSEYPREVIVVDTETNEAPQQDGTIGHVLAFGWAMYVRRARGDTWLEPQWFRFTDKAAFWSWACAKVRGRGRVTLYCHNAEFDAQVLDAFGELRRRKWRLVSACLEGPPTIIRWRRGTRTIRFLDSLNLWRVPLAEIGKKVGLRKLKMPSKWRGTPAEDRYCRRDVEIVWRALLSWWAFLKQHDLGTAAPTLAGQAFSSYRHRFMPKPIFIDSNDQALQLARDSYVGGRCEAFRLGLIDQPTVTLDVNSMYPYVMRLLEAPTQLLTVRTMASLDDLERYLKSYAVIADVELDTPDPIYPHVIEGRLCFPVGKFRQALATPELRHAMEHGHVKRLHRVAIYERAPIFLDFVQWAWFTRLKARKAGDTLLDWQVKIMANSLYGKFGQRGRQWEMAGRADDFAVRNLSSFDIDLGRWRNVRQIGDALQELQDKGESLHSHPAIAAHVTSAARLFLWKLIVTAGRDDVWYVDTDSLKGARAITKRLARWISPAELGGLKIERRSPWVHIHGAKDYEEPTLTRRKGVRADAKSTDGVAFSQLQWFGWAGSIARGRLDMPLMKPVVKILSRTYTKGTVDPSGRVTPFELGPTPGKSK